MPLVLLPATEQTEAVVPELRFKLNRDDITDIDLESTIVTRADAVCSRKHFGVSLLRPEALPVGAAVPANYAVASSRVALATPRLHQLTLPADVYAERVTVTFTIESGDVPMSLTLFRYFEVTRQGGIRPIDRKEYSQRTDQSYVGRDGRRYRKGTMERTDPSEPDYPTAYNRPLGPTPPPNGDRSEEGEP